MDELKVREIMQTEVVTVRPDATVGDLADILAKNKVSGVPVVDDQGGVLGMVSEADIILQDADLHFPYYIQFLESVIYLQSVRKFEERFRKAFGSKVINHITVDNPQQVLLEVKVAQVIGDYGIVPDQIHSLQQVFFSLRELIQFEQGPSQRVEIGSVVGIDRKCFFHILQGFLKPNPAIRQHVADVVQCHGVFGIFAQNVL